MTETNEMTGFVLVEFATQNIIGIAPNEHHAIDLAHERWAEGFSGEGSMFALHYYEGTEYFGYHFCNAETKTIEDRESKIPRQDTGK